MTTLADRREVAFRDLHSEDPKIAQDTGVRWIGAEAARAQGMRTEDTLLFRMYPEDQTERARSWIALAADRSGLPTEMIHTTVADCQSLLAAADVCEKREDGVMVRGHRDDGKAWAILVRCHAWAARQMFGV